MVWSALGFPLNRATPVRDSLEDADLQLQAVQDLRDAVDVSKQVVCGHDLFGIKVRIILLHK